MRIEFQGVSKRYGVQQVIKDLSYTFEENQSYAIYGPNGSGKSSVLQLIAGIQSPNQGKIIRSIQETSVSLEELPLLLSFSSPYMELPEELNFYELINMHFSFREAMISDAKQYIIQQLGYEKSKQIRNYSSGMKMRLKLILALTTKSQLVLLDEPTANFDEQGITWYQGILEELRQNRTLIIASAQPIDHAFCQHRLTLSL